MARAAAKTWLLAQRREYTFASQVPALTVVTRAARRSCSPEQSLIWSHCCRGSRFAGDLAAIALCRISHRGSKRSGCAECKLTGTLSIRFPFGRKNSSVGLLTLGQEPPDIAIDDHACLASRQRLSRRRARRRGFEASNVNLVLTGIRKGSGKIDEARL